MVKILAQPEADIRAVFLNGVQVYPFSGASLQAKLSPGKLNDLRVQVVNMGIDRQTFYVGNSFIFREPKYAVVTGQCVKPHPITTCTHFPIAVDENKAAVGGGKFMLPNNTYTINGEQYKEWIHKDGKVLWLGKDSDGKWVYCDASDLKLVVNLFTGINHETRELTGIIGEARTEFDTPYIELPLPAESPLEDNALIAAGMFAGLLALAYSMSK